MKSSALRSRRIWRGKAIDQFKETLEMDPEFEQARFELARAYLVHGKHTEALAEADRLRGRCRETLRAYLLARAGGREEALAWARGLEARSAREHMHPCFFPALWLALGDHDKALKVLEKACADHEPFGDLKIAPEMDPLRADPRFHEVLRCYKLE